MWKIRRSVGLSEKKAGKRELWMGLRAAIWRAETGARGAPGKTVVFGMLERDGQVKGHVVSNVKRRTLEPLERANVKEGSTVSTDELRTYKDLVRFGYEYDKVEHGTGEYVSGIHYVNSLEGFWSQLKRVTVGKDTSKMFERVIRNF
jgi:transposase-like protein